MEKIEPNTVHDSSFSGLRNSVGTSTTNIINPESQLLNGMIENTFHDSSFNGLRNSVGTNIINPESQLLNGMMKDNNMFKRKKSSVSNNSYLMDLNHSQELDLSDDNLDEISYGYNRDLLSESDDNSEYERNINEFLLLKKNFNKAPESELDAQSSIYTDTETQSEYSIESRVDPETLNKQIWYYKQNSDDKLNQNNENVQDYSDDESSTIAENNAAIEKLKLHHYVSTNNLTINKKDNSMLKRRTTIATANHLNNNKLNNKRDFMHGINENDIPLFNTEDNYFIMNPSQDDFHTSMLLSKTGDASRKRRSEMSTNRNRSNSQFINENYSTIAPPLSSNSIKKFTSSKAKTNIANTNSSKQPQLNSPMEVDHSTHINHNLNSNKNNSNNTQANTTISNVNDENSNQIYNFIMMAKDLFTFGKGKVKRTNTIKSTSSRSSIRKNQKKPSISRHRLSAKRKNTYNQTINFPDLSEDDMASMDTYKSYHRSSSSVALKNKSSNVNQMKNANRKSNNISRNSSLLSASTRRSSYGRNKVYQNDAYINYSASNLSDSTGLEIDDAKKFEESFDLNINNHNKNSNLRVYGVCPAESYYSGYHAPIVSSIDGRSSLFEDEEDEESVVSESDNGINDNYNDLYDIKNKLTMQPIADSLSNYSAIFSDKYSNKYQKKSFDPSSSKENEGNKKSLLKKLHSTSTIETSLSAKSLTPTVTNGKERGHMDHMDEESETTNTVKGSTYGGDNKSVATTGNIAAIPRNAINNYGAYSTVSYNNNKRNWDDGSSSYSHLNDNESRYQEIASMPENIKDYNNYSSPIKQVPIDYYRLGVYMYITNPVIVQTRTMMERMFSAHTLYTITVKLLRPNLPMYRNDNVCTFTVHKRYRQFRSFFKEIHKKYKDQITGWPEFPKKTFFDRFDDNTIIERADAFSKLMSFISLHPYLYNCPVLLTFLEITGSMNNRFASINSNIRGNHQLENSSAILEGKTIPFEGRNIAPTIPKLYGSIGRRQHPPGFYGQVPFTSMDTVGTSLNNSSPNLNNNIISKRPGYYNPNYYSSFSKPRLTKMKTMEILKNNNSYYSSLSSSNENNKNESEKSEPTELSTTANQTTPKLNTVNLKNNELSENTTTSKPPLVNQDNNNGNNNQPSINSSHTLDQKSALIPNSPDANYSDATTPKITHAVTAITTITSPESPISINNDLLITPTPTQSTTNFATPLEGIEAKPSTRSTSSSTSSLTTTIENSNLKIEIPDKKMNNTDSIDSTDSTITTGNVHHNKFNDDITDSSILSSPINSPINFMNISTTTTATTNATTTATISSTSPVSSQNSKLKGKAVLNDETIEEKVDSITKNKSTTPPPVRPRIRYRPGNTTYRTEDDPNYMLRYNQYQQIQGFQYLMSEFPKLRSDQNKRYSSIF